MVTIIGQLLWGEHPGDDLRFENSKLCIDTISENSCRRQEPEIVGFEKSRLYFSKPHLCYVDGKIQVFRADFERSWSDYRIDCLSQRSNFSAISVITLLSCVGAMLASSRPMVRAALAACAIASFVLVAIGNYKVRDALKEQDSLRNYVTKIAALREQAHTHGFLYAYEKKSKLDPKTAESLLPSEIGNACLLPSEVQFLFSKYITEYCDKMVEQEPTSEAEHRKWFADFQTNNPLSDELFFYGIDQDQIKRFKALKLDYDQREHTLTGSKQNYERQELLAKKTTEQNLDALEDEKISAFLYLAVIFDALCTQTKGENPQADPSNIATFYILQHKSVTDFIQKESQNSQNESRQTLAQTLDAIKKAKDFSLEQKIAKNLLIGAKNMVQDPDSEYLDGLFSFAKIEIEPIPLMPRRDFLAEARQHFSQNEDVLNFLNTAFN